MSALTSNILEEDIEAISSHRLIWLSSTGHSTITVGKYYRANFLHGVDRVMKSMVEM